MCARFVSVTFKHFFFKGFLQRASSLHQDVLVHVVLRQSEGVSLPEPHRRRWLCLWQQQGLWLPSLVLVLLSFLLLVSDGHIYFWCSPTLVPVVAPHHHSLVVLPVGVTSFMAVGVSSSSSSSISSSSSSSSSSCFYSFFFFFDFRSSYSLSAHLHISGVLEYDLYRWLKE